MIKKDFKKVLFMILNLHSIYTEYLDQANKGEKIQQDTHLCIKARIRALH